VGLPLPPRGRRRDLAGAGVDAEALVAASPAAAAAIAPIADVVFARFAALAT
jgi:hypothetical protein